MSGTGARDPQRNGHKMPSSNKAAGKLGLERLSLNGGTRVPNYASDELLQEDPLGGLAAHKQASKTHQPEGNSLDSSRSKPSDAQLDSHVSSGQASSHSTRASSEGQSMTPAEIEDGGATAISYGQNDSFTQQLMAGALKLKSSLFRQERVSFADIAHNPSLAKRARAEMDNHHFKGMVEGPEGSALEGRPHDLEVARLQVSLDVVDTDARQEAKVNAQLAQLVHMRLDAARKAVERLLGILQAMTSAEAAYSRAMTAVSRVKLPSEFDGPSLRSALNRLSDIPWLVGETHANNQSQIVEVTKSCQEIVAQLRKDCAAIAHDCPRAQSDVIHARKALHQAFLTHSATCRAADELVMERARSGKTASSRIEMDPWLTECRVVSAHQLLHNAQTKQRALLALAHEKVQHHDEIRCSALHEVLDAALKCYRENLGADPKEEAGLREVMEKVDCTEDLRHFTASANAAVSTSRELAERQQQALEAASQDLLCGPDIIRQGQMARWVAGSGKWSDCHFILTRSGFLHWLADSQDATLLGSLNLLKCHFEAGEAPQFNITEQQGGFFSKGKKMCFEASSIEECCEWAIAIRESIAAHRAK